jgi:hypothetical protein
MACRTELAFGIIAAARMNGPTSEVSFFQTDDRVLHMMQRLDRIAPNLSWGLLAGTESVDENPRHRLAAAPKPLREKGER